MADAAGKFDRDRASEYGEQSRIALAGYDACHELAACLLSSVVGRGSRARVLIAGVGGTAQEIIAAGRLEPEWQFTGVDPSPPMLDAAQSIVQAAGMLHRASFCAGFVTDLPEDEPFDAATLIGVLHHLAGRQAKLAVLQAIACRLKPNAPFVLACNRGAYRQNSAFLGAWANRWRMAGAVEGEVDAKLSKILQGADPPSSNEEVAELLRAAGFEAPELFFSSLFWGAWIARRRA